VTLAAFSPGLTVHLCEPGTKFVDPHTGATCIVVDQTVVVEGSKVHMTESTFEALKKWGEPG
jgi:hypothetical protein